MTGKPLRNLLSTNIFEEPKKTYDLNNMMNFLFIKDVTFKSSSPSRKRPSSAVSLKPKQLKPIKNDSNGFLISDGDCGVNLFSGTL